MYLTGMGTTINTIFEVTTMTVSIPSLVIITCFIASLWGGSIRFTPPMLFALAFLPMFGIGGFTGMPLALSTSDVMLHDSYYVIGHFHYIVAPGTIFAIFAGVYHWYPRITGRQMNRVMAHLHFWPSLVFMNVIFFSMLIQGLAGVSRRLYDGGAYYAHAQHVLVFNKVMTHSALGLALFQLPFLVNLAWSAFAGKRVDENPWDATTLEWSDPPDEVFRGPYAYGTPYADVDFAPQYLPEEGS
jgi:cytochrome c oxidase subunit 1